MKFAQFVRKFMKILEY